MKLTVNNMAAVSQASIDIDGITVICGKNDTGKSTLSRSLWCLFNGFSRYGEQIKSEKHRSIARAIDSSVDFSLNGLDSYFDPGQLANELVSEPGKLASDKPFVRKTIRGYFESLDAFRQGDISINIDETVDAVMELARVSDESILNRLLTNRFVDEFHQQVNNINSNGSGHVELCIKNEKYCATLERDIVVGHVAPHALRTRAVYIDDPFVLDRMERLIFRFSMDNHQSELLDALRNEPGGHDRDVLKSIVADDRLQRVLDRMSEAVGGSMAPGAQGRYVYLPAGKKKPLDIHNISAGMKAFVILKQLLQNGTIEQHGTVILDEPEVHLHPEWQLTYAETVVLLQKEFDLHVLLNTHSPYFLHAIEVYAAKHRIADRCRYYMMTRDSMGCQAQDVTQSIEDIYKEMASPFATLDEQMFEE